jgi:NADPH:quinone reductase-like Zn-dependent oxidoreductase
MFAVTATAIDPDEPLTGLTLGEHPEPTPPAGWEVVEVRAAALNHHDLWTLRGVGIDPARLPIVLGCDASGVTTDGREVVVHAVIADPDGNDETLSGDFSILSEQVDGTFAERLVGTAPQPGRQTGRAELRGSRLPAGGVADRLPDAVHAGRAAAGAAGPDPGRRRWGRHRGAAARTCGRPARDGDQPGRGEAGPRGRWAPT